MPSTLLSLWQGVLHYIYPQLCVHCKQALLFQEQILCIECQSQFAFTNYHHLPNNETVLRLSGSFEFQHASSLAYFVPSGVVQSLLHELKYQNNKSVGRYLGDVFAEDLLAGASWIQDISIIVPVPLHQKKLAKRGYNQSEIIAEAMAKKLGMPICKDVLKRLVDTESQTKKTRAERAKNIQNAFGIMNMEILKDKHVLLVDDVLTTGATLQSCANILSQIPGLKISIATIAIAN